MRPFISGRGGSAAGGVGVEAAEQGVRATQQSELVTYVHVQRRQWITGRQCHPTAHPSPLQAWAVCRFTSSANGRGQLWNGFRMISLAQRKKNKTTSTLSFWFLLYPSSTNKHKVQVINNHWLLVCKQVLKCLYGFSENAHFPKSNTFQWRLNS